MNPFDEKEHQPLLEYLSQYVKRTMKEGHERSDVPDICLVEVDNFFDKIHPGDARQALADALYSYYLDYLKGEDFKKRAKQTFHEQAAKQARDRMIARRSIKQYQKEGK